MSILDIKYTKLVQNPLGRYDMILPDGTFIMCNELDDDKVVFTIEIPSGDIIQEVLPIDRFVVGINEYIAELSANPT